MHYLTIAAAYRGSCVRHSYGDPVEPETLSLPAGLCNDLRAWNSEYQVVIPMATCDLQEPEMANLVRRLDQEGTHLAERVKATLREAKVRYYSEGNQRYLT